MKPEQKQLLDFIIKMVVLIAFASLYSMGGSADFWGGQIWIRRWLATFLFSGAAFALSKDWKYALTFPLMAGSLTLPYGSDVLGVKIGLRAMCGAVSGLAFNTPNLFNGKWLLTGYGILICILTSVILGVFNPTPNAITEQGAIAMIFGFTYVVGINKKQGGTV